MQGVGVWVMIGGGGGGVRWRGSFNRGEAGVCWCEVLRPDAGGSKLVYLGDFGFMAHWFFSLSRHFSWSPPLPPLSIHQSGWSYSMLRMGRKLWCPKWSRQTGDRLKLYQWNIDHEESAILLASCWIVKYLCKIAHWEQLLKSIYKYIFFFLVRSHLLDSKILGYKRQQHSVELESIALWEIRGAVFTFIVYYLLFVHLVNLLAW